MLDQLSSRTVFILIAIVWVAIVMRAATNTKGPEAFIVTVSQGEVQDFARAQLAAIQRQSFTDGQERCAIIFEDGEGRLNATPLTEGEKASCDVAYFDEPGMAPVASFHTHGGFDNEYDSEVPSLLDLRSDIESGLDGYVSTPGGRFWRVNAAAKIAELICGERCLPQDPKYVPCKADQIADSYTVEQLRVRNQETFNPC